MALSLSSNAFMPLNGAGNQALDQAGTYNDIASLDKLRATAQKDEKKALREVAQQFESIFMQMVLKGMRQANAAFESDLGNSNYTKFYRDMSDQQMAMNMSQQGALGLADIMVEQLDPSNSNLTPASVLRHAEASRIHAEPAATSTTSKLSELKRTAQSETAEHSKVTSHQGVPLKSAANRVEQPSFKTPEEFVQQLMPFAEKTAKSLGVDAKAILAQAALETGWGQKIIKNADGSSSFNLFNIKSAGGWQGDKASVSTLEFEEGLPVKKTASFRAYQNFQHSFDDYHKFLSNSSRYEKAISNGDDSAGFLHGLQRAGYATDPNYAAKALSVLKRVTGMLNP